LTKLNDLFRSHPQNMLRHEIHVQFGFFPNETAEKPPTYQTKLTSFEKNCHILRRSLNTIELNTIYDLTFDDPN
jgi:hypothetical protein